MILPNIAHNSATKLYADDSKIYKGGMDPEHLQDDIGRVCDWFFIWQLSVNFSKCLHLSIAKRNNAKNQFSISNVPILCSDVVRDLGIHMSSSLDFSAHCGIIAGKAASRVGLVLRAFRSRDKKFMLSLYTTHIRPILEYNTEVWSPLFKKDIDLIESIQKKFLKRIRGFSGLSYLERMHQCNLESLELRRIRRDLILTYKIVHGLINLPFDDYFVYAPDVGTRGHTRKLLVKRARLNIVKNFSLLPGYFYLELSAPKYYIYAITEHIQRGSIA